MTFTPPNPVTTRPELRGTFGMVASTHWLASAAAQSVLERGGNAVDAAVAGAFVLHIVEAHLNGPGGDLTAILSVEGADPVVVCGQGVAPAAATVGRLRGEGLSEVPGAGTLAAAVPGSVVTWFTLLERYGTWELADVVEPAIGYARNGYPVLPAVVRTIDAVHDLFEQHWPTSAARWLPEGRRPIAGELATNTVWADALARLVAAGSGLASREQRIRAARNEWQHGFVAEAIDGFVREPLRHSDGGDHAGVITAADVAGFETRFEEPVTFAFRGTTLHKAGPWTQGPVLLQTLAILDRFPDEALDPSTALGIHTITEAMNLAMADRDAFYGDPDATDVPLPALLDPDYVAERAALIGETASLEWRPGRPGGATPWRPPLIGSDAVADGTAGTGEPTVSTAGVTRGDTCHIDVIDRWGTLISATPSGGWLQSSPTIPELGFCLGTRLQMTWLDPASPSALRPGYRPRSTLSPTMLSRDGRPVEALGTPGGDQQDQWQLLYLLRRIVGGYDPQAAIDAPMFHSTALVSSFEPRTCTPGGLVVEGRVGAAVIDELKARGHRVTASGDWTLGRLSAVGIDPRGGVFAAATSRGAQGYAAGR